jgi:hypothetical protein
LAGRRRGQGRRCVEYELSRDQYVRIRRCLLALRRQAVGRKLKMPKGLDGLWVGGVDGQDVGLRLLAWSEGRPTTLSERVLP